MFRNALELEAVTCSVMTKGHYSKRQFITGSWRKMAVIGANGIGKTTFLKTLVGEQPATSGMVKWSENSSIGYYAQDHAEDFETDLTVFDWMSQWKSEGMTSKRCSILGRLLFSQDDIKKKVKCYPVVNKGVCYLVS